MPQSLQLYSYVGIACPNQLTSVADRRVEFPTTTLITSSYIAIWYICSFCYVFNTNAPTIHALIRSKSLWRIYLVQPKEFSFPLAAVTFESSVHYDKLLIAYSGTENKLSNYHHVLTCHHYRPYICHRLALWLSGHFPNVLDNLSRQ